MWPESAMRVLFFVGDGRRGDQGRAIFALKMGERGRCGRTPGRQNECQFQFPVELPACVMRDLRER